MATIKRVRVRSGCRTCKTRRIKCDEERPSCRKCVNSGRTCEGYGIWGPAPSILKDRPNQQAHDLVYRLAYPPGTLSGLAPDETFYLDRFRNISAATLTKPFDSHFWSSVVLQLSVSEPAVQHASIAFASAYESCLRVSSRDGMTRIPPRESFFLGQYNRAIQVLTSSVNPEDSRSLRVALVSCVLFICLEILRGDLAAMQGHFSSGVKLLRQLQRLEQQSSPTSNTVLVKHELKFFDDYLVDVFSRLNLQFIMLGHGSQLKQKFIPLFKFNGRIHIPRRFSGSSEARQSLNTVLIAVIHLIKEVSRDAMAVDVQPLLPSRTALEKQKVLEGVLAECTTSLEDSTGALSKSASPQERLCLSMLRIYVDVATIILATCFSIKETSYDEHLPIFECIINRYRDLWPGRVAPVSHGARPPHESRNDTKSNKSLPSFSVDIAFFPPLYFTALKCRDHRTRQAALSILREYPHMEGPWTGPMLAKVAGHVVDMEENNFKSALQQSSTRCESPADIPRGAVSPPSVVLPEFCRFYCVECHLPDRCGRESKIGSLTVTRFRHELGKAGSWCIAQCEVDLSCDDQ